MSVDCLRADHLGCYGYDRSTSPTIDEFVKSATLFENAYANCPGTRWAFQSLHTGVSTLRINGLGIPDRYESLARQFQKRGYATGGFAVNGYVSRDYGYDAGFETFYGVHDADAASKYDSLIQIGKWINRTLGNDHVRDQILLPIYRRLRGTSTNGDQFQPDHHDGHTVAKALDFIKRNQTDERDYFCWLHFMDAHTPYGYWPDELKAIRGDSEIEHTIDPGREGRITKGEDPPSCVIDTYDACIRRIDSHINRVFEVIDDDTIVVLTGDHGEEFGKYNEFHTASLYSSMTQVPIIIRAPNISVGTMRMPVQHLDLPVTMLASEGLQPPNHWEGSALQNVSRSKTKPIFFSLDYGHTGVRKGEWKYINDNDEIKLFKTGLSGEETNDEIDRYPELGDKLSELLVRYRDIDTIDQGITTNHSELTDEVEENLSELGYID